jgi:two-component system, OmpR family, catabolic regulation response regulator CreB
MSRILVVEDEPAIADAVEYALSTEGLTVVRASTLQAAQQHLSEADLVVLDVSLPDGSGFDFCRELRKNSTIPVIFLTSRASEVDRVVGLELGADDYVVKPFSPRELSARVRAILRRMSARQVTPLGKVALIIDEDRRSVSWHGVTLDLTRYEFRLLAVLVARPGMVFPRTRLLDLVWERPDGPFDRTVDTHIKTLRAKLQAAHPASNPIRTLRGEGYAWEETT